MATNLKRRHLSTSQKALAAVEIMRRTELNRKQAAKLLSISERSITSATNVVQHAASHVIEFVRNGQLSVSLADKFSQSSPIGLQPHFATLAKIKEVAANAERSKRPVSAQKLWRLLNQVIELEARIEQFVAQADPSKLTELIDTAQKAGAIIGACAENLQGRMGRSGMND